MNHALFVAPQLEGAHTQLHVTLLCHCSSPFEEIPRCSRADIIRQSILHTSEIIARSCQGYMTLFHAQRFELSPADRWRVQARASLKWLGGFHA